MRPLFQITKAAFVHTVTVMVICRSSPFGCGVRLFGSALGLDFFLYTFMRMGAVRGVVRLMVTFSLFLIVSTHRKG